jgi:hypothetical protein
MIRKGVICSIFLGIRGARALSQAPKPHPSLERIEPVGGEVEVLLPVPAVLHEPRPLEEQLPTQHNTQPTQKFRKKGARICYTRPTW